MLGVGINNFKKLHFLRHAQCLLKNLEHAQRALKNIYHDEDDKACYINK
jgi:hypothetical protein